VQLCRRRMAVGEGWACRIAVNVSAPVSRGSSDGAGMLPGRSSTSSPLRPRRSQSVRPSADFDRYVNQPPQRGGVPYWTEPLAVDCRPPLLAEDVHQLLGGALPPGLVVPRTGRRGVTPSVTPPAVIGRTRPDWPRLPQEGTGLDTTRRDARPGFLNLARVFDSPRGYQIAGPPQAQRPGAPLPFALPLGNGRRTAVASSRPYAREDGGRRLGVVLGSG
jgi:hypothetical protein